MRFLKLFRLIQLIARVFQAQKRLKRVLYVQPNQFRLLAAPIFFKTRLKRATSYGYVDRCTGIETDKQDEHKAAKICSIDPATTVV